MRKHKILITCTLLWTCLAVGCSQEKSISDLAPSLLTHINETGVEWVTKKGGFLSDKNWVVLFPQKDSDKIKKIIALVNSGTIIRKSTKEDLYFRHYGVDIVMKYKDGSEVSLKSIEKFTTKEVANRAETTSISDKDRYVICFSNNNKNEYYTVFSNETAEYILNTSDADFPMAPKFVIIPENFKLGDMIEVSGSGCSESEINIILSNGNDADLEEYIIGKAKPAFGSWRWEGVLNKNLKTYDGKDIFFKHDIFLVGIKVGISKISKGIQIRFR